MTKRRTKAQKCKDYYDAFRCIREDRKMEREGTKDGSIATHPVVDILVTKAEKFVIAECLTWLKKHNVFCNRHDAGTFQNIRGDWGTYGIKGSGDIHGMLRNHDGKHFEIECKVGFGGRLSLIQQKRMRQIRENNGLYFVVHGVEELEHYFGELI